MKSQGLRNLQLLKLNLPIKFLSILLHLKLCFTVVYTKAPNSLDLVRLPKSAEFSTTTDHKLTQNVQHVHNDVRGKLDKKYAKVEKAVDKHK